MQKTNLTKFIESNGKKYYPVIGMEIHAELNTKTKMWCGCKNDPFEDEPNKHVCPICMANPGTLPVPNLHAIQNVMKMGFAVGGNIANFTEFDRKNYFYPDIPKGYQISQYKFPIVSSGKLNSVELTRIHLEEDTATSAHDKDDATLINFNRAGVPLMELVTEPVIYDAEAAVAFAKEMQLFLKTLNISDADIEKGHMRMEANISISVDPTKFGTKVEVKNIGSFKSLEGAIKYEFKRHIEALETGVEIVQETRGYDEASGTTKSQRTKENSADYRYFPDPDLTKMYLHDNPIFEYEKIKNSLPELPDQKRLRYEKLELKKETVELFVAQPIFGNYFDSVVSTNLADFNFINLAANYISSDIVGIYKKSQEENSEFLFPNVVNFKILIKMLVEEKLASRGAKDILVKLFADQNLDPLKFAQENDLLQISDEAKLLPIIQLILADEKNTKSIADYKKGIEPALMALVGQAIKQTNGKANPTVTKKLFISALA